MLLRLMITLRPYQQEAMQAFADKRGAMLLYADTGTGKTFCALEIIKKLILKHGHKPILILCPASIVKQWLDETVRYLGVLPVGLIITNYEKLLTDPDLRATDWLFICADECQYICMPTAKRSRAFHKLKTTYKLAMSATPAPNHLAEFYSVVQWLSPNVWHRSFWQFKQRECVLDYFGGIVGYRDEKRLRALIAPLIHRVTKDVLTELPELHTQTITIHTLPDWSAAYDDMRKTCRAEIDGKRITIPNVVSLISRQRQFVDAPHLFGYGDSPKMGTLRKILIDKKPTLIFVEHQETARILSEKYSCPMITGATPMKQRDKIVADFQDGKYDILVGTYTNAVGRNIQRATRVISYSQYWNPARIDQSVGRSYRMGQQIEVEHITLIVKGTIDEKIAKLISQKRIHESKFSREEILSLL